MHINPVTSGGQHATGDHASLRRFLEPLVPAAPQPRGGWATASAPSVGDESEEALTGQRVAKEVAHHTHPQEWWPLRKTQTQQQPEAP